MEPHVNTPPPHPPQREAQHANTPPPHTPQREAPTTSPAPPPPEPPSSGRRGHRGSCLARWGPPHICEHQRQGQGSSPSPILQRVPTVRAATASPKVVGASALNSTRYKSHRPASSCCVPSCGEALASAWWIPALQREGVPPLQRKGDPPPASSKGFIGDRSIPSRKCGFRKRDAPDGSFCLGQRYHVSSPILLPGLHSKASLFPTIRSPPPIDL